MNSDTHGSPLIGRSTEIREMRSLISPDRAGTGSLVLLGEAGIGKTALLSDLARHGSASGLRVLAGAGLERESAVVLAGLQRLLRPVSAELLALPGQDASELRASLDMAARVPKHAASARRDSIAVSAPGGSYRHGSSSGASR